MTTQSATIQESCPNRFWMAKIVLAVLALVGASSVAATQPAFPLHTAGQYIVDRHGQRVRLNSANWYGAESTDFVVGGLQGASLEGIVDKIKDLGFNAVRLPWSNELYESNPVVPSYALAANPGMQGEDALTILDQVVKVLTRAEIMVILDNHSSNAEWCCGPDGNTLWYNAQYPQTSWISDWEGMAARYKNNPWVIGADLRNEPRENATWGGSSATNWQAAAELGGNAVLAVNPNLLIFVEGVNYAIDLSGVAGLPVRLNVANKVVYSIHDYSFFYSVLTSYEDYVSQITPSWGYLVTGINPQPLFVGEFGTCNTARNCVISSNSADNGYWFGFITTYLLKHDLDWCYWPINGTQSTGSGRIFGSLESYGVLNTSWDGGARAPLTSRLRHLIHSHTARESSNR
jgi:endoglucanase